MIKVGVFLEEMDPKEGGASALLSTIKNELEKATGAYEIVILYRGGFKQKYRIGIEGITYINVTAGHLKFWLSETKKRVSLKVKNAIKKCLHLNTMQYEGSILDAIAKQEKIDLIWFTYPILEKTSVPYIFTVWDLGHRVLPMMPEVSVNWNAREELYQKMLYQASYILTGNEFGKEEILKNYNLCPEKIRTVPFPLSEFCRGEEILPERVLPERYFFYPAQFWPHKNHIVVLKALKWIWENCGEKYHVVFTGSDKGSKEYIEKMCKEYGLVDQVHFLGFVSYEEMKYLYKHATGMVFASLMGPNNLPPMEAAYLGCPVILTDIPGHIEQLKDSALYFMGTNEIQLAEHMIALQNDKDGIRERLRERQKTLDYDWNYVGAVFDIIEEIERYIRTWKNTT